MSTIHAHVGAKIRARRAGLEISPAALADYLDISVSDLESYETGRRRICVSLLFGFANVLNVEIAYFFSGMTVASDYSPPPPRTRHLHLVH